MSPILAQISPLRIHRINQIDFFLPRPALYLLFTGDGRFYVQSLLEINKPVNLVSAGKTIGQIMPMFVYPAFKIVCHTDVEGVGIVGQDINVIGVHRNL
jgi:hypothetical protein